MRPGTGKGPSRALFVRLMLWASIRLANCGRRNERITASFSRAVRPTGLLGGNQNSNRPARWLSDRGSAPLFCGRGEGCGPGRRNEHEPLDRIDTTPGGKPGL